MRVSEFYITINHFLYLQNVIFFKQFQENDLLIFQQDIELSLLGFCQCWKRRDSGSYHC